MLRLFLKVFFFILSKLNKFLLPSMIGKDIQQFNKVQFGILGFKYWVTKNYLKYRK